MSDNTKRTLVDRSPRLFTPQIQRGVKDGQSSGARIFQLQDGSVTNDTSLGVTSSYKYNPHETGLVSTQQLNIDWAKFENHTFFNSAQVKTNVAFQKVFDEYPFDGSRRQTESFLDSLTGFEKWVYDEIPKKKNYLFFSGSAGGYPEGTGVIVKDSAGAQFTEASSNKSGQSILSPGLESLAIESHIYVASGSSVTQFLFSNASGSAGNTFGCAGYILGPDIVFTLGSGSVTQEISCEIERGVWNHIAFVYDRNPYVNKFFIYKNGELAASSSNIVEFGYIDCKGNDLLIGSGDLLGSSLPTLSGALDEFRIWKTARTQEQIKQYMYKNVFTDDDLVLYFKFNEPNTVNSPIVIDSSKNSLHGRLTANSMLLGVRSNEDFGTMAGDSPMTYESLRYNPVLFPNYGENVDLQQRLLVSASNYDDRNPNLITKLIPRHYFLEGQAMDGLEDIQGDIVNGLVSGTDPRSSRLGGTQALLLLLYTWAKFFDEMKLYAQAFSNLDFVDYDLTDTTPDEFIKTFAEKNGISLPPLFQGSSIGQFIEGENIQDEISTNSQSLQQVQNLIWRRILINMRDFMSSKGTMHSVKSFIRSIGLDPDNNFRIREFGGPTKASLEYTRDKRSEVTGMLDFSNGGFFTSPGLLNLPKVEPGWPYGGSPADGNRMLTSGSWTYEAIYRLPLWADEDVVVTQSLSQITLTGSLYPDGGGLLGNVHAISDERVVWYFRPLNNDPIELSLNGPNLFDGELWNISYGIKRSDDETDGVSLNSNVSSSLFIRATKQTNGEITEEYVTSSFYVPGAFPASAELTMLAAASEQMNVSGAFYSIGPQSYTDDVLQSGEPLFLTDTTLPSYGDYIYNDFAGKVSQIRFWSKYVTEDEWHEHVRNYKSVGARDPKTNWNFDTTASGSWNRLRLDVSMDQPVTSSDVSGALILEDFTQNFISGSNRPLAINFPATSSILVPQKIFYSYVSPKYDMASSVNKVRVRGYEDIGSNIVNAPWAVQGPVNEVPENETPTDNERFAIEFSVIDALDQDIMTIFGTLQELDNALGDPNLLFSQDYPSLEILRKNYFNKLTDKMNLKGFFEFFKWFDTNISTFVAQLLPRKTRFTGTNFVVESHAIERPKIEYKFEDQYLTESDRAAYKTVLLMRAISGDFNRY